MFKPRAKEWVAGRDDDGLTRWSKTALQR